MSEYINIGNKVSDLRVGTELVGITKVVINISEESQYIAGDNRGRCVTLECPWGSQRMAENILGTLRGYSYQPYSAENAIVNPAAELGDGVNIGGFYGGLAHRTTHFKSLSTADIGAPISKEIDHEYPYKPPAERKIERQLAHINSEFLVHSEKIAAKVSSTGGDIESFGWELTESGFILASGSKEIFRADNSGIKITGEINALSGFIGSGSRGFKITDTAISHGMTALSDNSHNGIYLGSDGISLGKGKFQVDAYGNLYAQSGRFEGAVYAKNVETGGTKGYISGGQIGGGAVSSYNCDSYMEGGASNGYYAYDRLNDNATANYIRVTTLNPTAIIIGNRHWRLSIDSSGLVHATTAY